MQFEVPRGVKSKKFWRAELNKSWRDSLVPWHDFLGREACFWEDQIVTRFPISWRDFEKDLEHELGFKTNRGVIYSNRGAILASENISYLNKKLVLETGVTIWEEQSAILRPKDGYEGDFFNLLSVPVCFDSTIDYAICKFYYE